MDKMNITMTINGRPFDLDLDIRKSLMDVLRELGFTSVKQGCGVGECGGCTVLVDDVPVDTCIYLALWAAGKTIRTVEGEAKDGQLTQIQEAYVEAGAIQCGFCTPGLIMRSTSFVEQSKGKKVTTDDIRKGHAGNLCRCTGYTSIVRAVGKVVDLVEEE